MIIQDSWSMFFFFCGAKKYTLHFVQMSLTWLPQMRQRRFGSYKKDGKGNKKKERVHKRLNHKLIGQSISHIYSELEVVFINL